MSRSHLKRILAPAMAALLVSLAVRSQQQPERDDISEVVVTGLRVGQGGAQDIKFFRGEVAFERIPHPNAFTAEGLLSEHDIVLPADAPCRQLFCLTGDATRAELIAVPQARYLVGVGFDTNITAETWRRGRVNLIAVVDKSGSMAGTPLDLVRKSLATMAQQLRIGDQLTIVLYGDRAHVHMPTTHVADETMRSILASIEAIQSQGSTSMESGLRLGYDVANLTAPAFEGATRLVLFTDERPNTDATDAASFMAMASTASRQGVGLTTIGVGVQFGAELATKIGSVRGGNLYFIRNEADVRELFTGKLDYMVSELAHDLTITIAPRGGLEIAGIYGVPGTLLGWQSGERATVTIPTVFLDDNGGGIFIALAPDSREDFLPQGKPAGALADVSVSYLPLRAVARNSHAISIAMRDAGPSAGMQLARLLIDEFTVLHGATAAHYERNDQEAAFQLLDTFRKRLAATSIGGLDEETKLIDSLHTRIAFLSGHSAEGARAPAYVQLWGRWKVDHASGDALSIGRGATLEFASDNQVRISRSRSTEVMEYQSNDDQIYLPESDVVLKYELRGDQLSLKHARSGTRLFLERACAGQPRSRGLCRRARSSGTRSSSVRGPAGCVAIQRSTWRILSLAQTCMRCARKPSSRPMSNAWATWMA